jgi:hypothetical protein
MLSAFFVAFDEKVATNIVIAKDVFEAPHASNLLDQVAHFHTKHATELANAANAYDVKLDGDIEVAEEEYTRKVCIAESIS